MEKILFVGGTFDNDGGKPSSVVSKFVTEFQFDDIKCDIVNGGHFNELETILNSTINYKYVIWWANVPNDMPKIRNVKEVNPKCILVTSKRNDNNQYGFAELINRALAAKANLCVEFSKWNDIYAMRIFDPLGNQWYYGYNILDASRVLIKRMNFLAQITRQSCLQANENIEIPKEKEFFKLVKNYADVFHDLIQPDNGVTRFLGNSSFRCQRGFPSFRKNDNIFVSRRNIDKRYIDKDGFVPVKLDDSVLWYYGEHKPSVDTPIQTRLYQMLPDINYMIHAHVYIEGAPFTKHNIPCGGIEEVQEIMDVIGPNTDKNFYAINLIGHGCIVMANDVKELKNLKYIARKMPEVIVD
jgi:hypothetical protein